MENKAYMLKRLPAATIAAIISSILWLVIALLPGILAQIPNLPDFLKTIVTIDVFISVFSIILLIASSLGVVELLSEHNKGYKKSVVKNWGIFYLFGGFIVTGVLLILLAKKIPTSDVTYKRPFSWKRWYKFNKQRIPFFLSIFSVIFITALLDFELSELKFSLKSHFDAITSLYSNQYKSAATFMVFLLNIVAIVQIFNTITFGQKKNPLSLYLITALTVVEIAAYIFYVYVFMVEPTLSPTYKLTASAQFSMSVFGIGILFGIASTAFAWKYVDWKYVKIED